MKEEYVRMKNFVVPAIDYASDIDYELGRAKVNLDEGAIINRRTLCEDEINKCTKLLKQLVDELKCIQSLCNTKIDEIDASNPKISKNSKKGVSVVSLHDYK